MCEFIPIAPLPLAVGETVLDVLVVVLLPLVDLDTVETGHISEVC